MMIKKSIFIYLSDNIYSVINYNSKMVTFTPMKILLFDKGSLMKILLLGEGFPTRQGLFLVFIMLVW